MTPPATGNKHIVTNEEIAEIEALGFAITSGKTPLTKVLQEYFPGFQLGEYLKSIDDLLSPLTEVKIEKELVYFEGDAPMLLLQYFSEDEADDETGLGLSRAFIHYPDELVVDHDFFRIPLVARQQGIGKQMLNISLQQYLRLGVDKIRLRAGLANGSYVWAKAFFSATKPLEVKTILNLAEKKLTPAQFKFVKRVYDNYYDNHPDGKTFPMVKWSDLPGMDVILSESEWHGELDLNNSAILTKFKYYVA
jgi:hypothetical protein